MVGNISGDIFSLVYSCWTKGTLHNMEASPLSCEDIFNIIQLVFNILIESEVPNIYPILNSYLGEFVSKILCWRDN